MNKLKVALMIGLCLAWISSANAVTLKIATLVPDGTSWMNQMRAGADEIAERTEGRVKLKFRPGGVEGSYGSVMSKMRLGRLQGGAFTGGEVGELYPDFNLYSLPFVFRSLAEVDAVRKELDAVLIAGLEKKGLVTAGIAGGGFAYLMSRDPISGKQDLQGRKIWVPEGDDVSYTFMKVAGVPAIPMSLADVYTALQTGALDTVINTPVGAIAFQWHTRVRNMLDLPVSYVVGLLALDAKVVKRLSDADRAVMMEVLAKVSRELERINLDDNDGARLALEKQGISFNVMSDVEKAQWWQTGEDTVKALLTETSFEHVETMQRTLNAFRQASKGTQ